MADIIVPLAAPMGKEALQQLQLFRDRFTELWSNWESLKKHGIKLGGAFANRGGGKISGPGCGVEIHRLKGYYLDFRFFWAKKEPTHYFKVSALIGKHCTDTRLRKCILENKKQWEEAGLLHGWHGIHAEDMIQALFNGQVFHSDSVLKSQVDQMQELMGNELAHHCLTYSVYSRMLVVRNLNWIIEPLTARCQQVRVPGEYVQQAVPADRPRLACLARLGRRPNTGVGRP